MSWQSATVHRSLPLRGSAAPATDGHMEPAAKRQRIGAAAASLPLAVVLDIEGTVAPISFVAEVRATALSGGTGGTALSGGTASRRPGEPAPCCQNAPPLPGHGS